MSNRPPFDPKELEVSGWHKATALGMFKNMGMGFMPEVEPLYNRPITPRENLKLLFSGQKPWWIPHTGMAYTEVNNFRPRIFPDNVATWLVMDGEEDMVYESTTNPGWFGLEWVFVPVAGGATVKPGDPLLEDMNDWQEVLQWPDLDAMDWEAMAAANKEVMDTPQANELCLLDGFWERLISLMDVSGAAMALIDEDQKEALHAFYDKYADHMIECIKRVKAVLPIDGVLIHDDWGTQNGPFFSLETAREMIVPYLKRIVDYLHSEGMFYEQHSCGNCTKLVPAYIDAGVDVWTPQDMNDFDAILELCQGTKLHIGMPCPVAPDASEEVARQAAHDWFAKYGEKQVTISPMAAHPIFMEELYKVSREAFAK